MKEHSVHTGICVAMVVVGFGVAAYMLCTGTAAPYGRHASAGRGFGLDARVAWVLMEAPNLVQAALCWGTAGEEARASWPNRVLLFLFVFHYVNRSLIYPLRMRKGRPMPLHVMLLAQVFCTVNGYLQGRHLTHLTVYPDRYWFDPRFVVGVAMFVVGWWWNTEADAILRSLRVKADDDGYRIPYGGLFKYVSGANYAGEIVEWLGFAVACWSLPALAFLIFTICNLGPRARAHHHYYRSRFLHYPKHRKAIIPYVW